MIHKLLHRQDRFEGKYIKSIVYGGLDGIVTTFAVVSGVTGANLASNVILILGAANLVADGISMAAGDYLSERAEQEYKLKLSKKSPVVSGIVTFCSFIIFGLIPLSIYIVSMFFVLQETFLMSCALTLCTLVILGIVRGKITGHDTVRAVFETIIIGSIAATAAYGVGAFVAFVV